MRHLLKSIFLKIRSRPSLPPQFRDRTHLGLLIMFAVTMSDNLRAESLTLYYEIRPPFMLLENGELKGSFGGQATEALQAAGISFTLSEAPVARQQLLIMNNKEPACAVGFYWTNARAKSGKYTLAIAHSSPQGIIFHSNNPKLESINTMESLFADPTLSIVLRNGYSYGETLDNMLLKAQAKILRPSEDSHGRAKLVLFGIVDAALFARDEADYQIRQFSSQENTFRFKQFPDSPEGKPRYLYCSNLVDDKTISKINDVLKKTTPNIKKTH